MDVESTVRAFNDAITRADIERLSGLIAPEHRFIDPAGQIVDGREAVVAAWRGFFRAFPGYRNVFEEFRVSGSDAVMRGYSVSEDSRLDGPALWRAEVMDHHLTLWAVHEDTSENRKNLGFASG